MPWEQARALGVALNRGTEDEISDAVGHFVAGVDGGCGRENVDRAALRATTSTAHQVPELGWMRSVGSMIINDTAEGLLTRMVTG